MSSILKSAANRAVRILSVVGLTGFVVCLNGPAKSLELVMFSASWCAQCQIFKKEVLPKYHRTSLGNRVPIFVLEDSHSQRLALDKSISGFPTFVLIQNGRELNRFSGYKDFIDFFDQFGRTAGRYLD